MNSEYTSEECNLPLEVKVYIKNLENIIEAQNKFINELDQKIDKAIDFIKEYGRDKQLEEDYLMSRYNLANYNITLLEILGDKEND